MSKIQLIGVGCILAVSVALAAANVFQDRSLIKIERSGEVR